jgi:hypothetical protein
MEDATSDESIVDISQRVHSIEVLKIPESHFEDTEGTLYILADRLNEH